MEHPRGTRESQMEHPEREKRIIQVKNCVHHLATNKSARRLAGLCISRFIRYIYYIETCVDEMLSIEYIPTLFFIERRQNAELLV